MTNIVEQQKDSTNQLKDTIITLTGTVNNLKQLTTEYFEKSPNTKSSPGIEQPVKRLKYRTEENSPTNIQCNLPDDPMEEMTNWESQTPNMSQPNQRSPSPSLWWPKRPQTSPLLAPQNQEHITPYI